MELLYCTVLSQMTIVLFALPIILSDPPILIKYTLTSMAIYLLYLIWYFYFKEKCLNTELLLIFVVSDYHLLITTLFCILQAFLVQFPYLYKYEESYEFWSAVQFFYFLLYIPKFPEDYAILIIFVEIFLIILQAIYNKLKLIAILYMILIFTAKAIILYYFPMFDASDLLNISLNSINFFAMSFYSLISEILCVEDLIKDPYESYKAFKFPYDFKKNMLIRDLKQINNEFTFNIIKLLAASIFKLGIFIYYFGPKIGNYEYFFFVEISVPFAFMIGFPSRRKYLCYINNFLAVLFGILCIRYALT